jgi:hypothetical protein
MLFAGPSARRVTGQEIREDLAGLGSSDKTSLEKSQGHTVGRRSRTAVTGDNPGIPGLFVCFLRKVQIFYLWQYRWRLE